MSDFANDEVWLPVAGHDLYEVSSRGRVRSWARLFQLGVRAESPKILKPYTIKSKRDGRVRLAVRLRGVSPYVHTLVASAFHGPRGDAECCRHLDGDTVNNASSNLKWGTHVQNNQDSVEHGTRIRGDRHHWSKLTERAVVAIRRSRASVCVLVARYNVSDETIRRVIRRETWRHVPEEA
jgi:hypothetical protein